MYKGWGCDQKDASAETGEIVRIKFDKIRFFVPPKSPYVEPKYGEIRDNR